MSASGNKNKLRPQDTDPAQDKKDALARGVPPGLAGSLQCVHIRRSTGMRCKAFAIKGSHIQKCKRHGGAALMGSRHPAYKTGRHSKYLPSHLQDLYDQAVNNPDILEMSDHLALLESRINDQLRSMQQGEPVPRWSDLRSVFDDLSTCVLEGKPEEVHGKLDEIFGLLDAGAKWDRAWDNILESMEQLRKVADVEIKRRRELHLMIPVERVMVLVTAVASAVKRHVTDPLQIAAVQCEIEGLLLGSKTMGGIKRLPPGSVDFATRKNQEAVRSGAMDAEIVG